MEATTRRAILSARIPNGDSLQQLEAAWLVVGRMRLIEYIRQIHQGSCAVRRIQSAALHTGGSNVARGAPLERATRHPEGFCGHTAVAIWRCIEDGSLESSIGITDRAQNDV
jgi:hypothetical protein